MRHFSVGVIFLGLLTITIAIIELCRKHGKHVITWCRGLCKNNKNENIYNFPVQPTINDKVQGCQSTKSTNDKEDKCDERIEAGTGSDVTVQPRLFKDSKRSHEQQSTDASTDGSQSKSNLFSFHEFSHNSNYC